MKSNPSSRHVAVIGGGISGLAAAYRLIEVDASLRVTLLESSTRLGGVLDTVREDGFLVESGADNFITTVPWALDLCRRIGFCDQLIQTNSQYRHAFVVRRGRLQPIPDGFVVMAPRQTVPMLKTRILSPLGKLRLAWERFVPTRRDNGDESLAAFCRRRLGRETYERLVQPLVGSIYTGDPERLSLAATMPRFAAMERQHGSLFRALRRVASKQESAGGARYSTFVAPRDGMASLVQALAARLPKDSLRLGSVVTALAPAPGGWRISTSSAEPLDCQAVILATPAAATARLVATLDGELASELQQIPHAGCCIVSLGYHRSQIRHPLDGFGVVVPQIEGRRILSASFSSVKYSGRAPRDYVLLRAFIGGACQSELTKLEDDELRELAAEELGQLLGITGAPHFVHVGRQAAAMPQYYLGHADRVARIADRVRRHPGLFLAGNAFEGVGIPHCVHSGQQAAEGAMSMLDDVCPVGRDVRPSLVG